mgnify:FL=1
MELNLDYIYNGDALEILKQLPSESIDMCITSPPYWNMRDYGVDGQLGNEETFEEYLDKLQKIFNEIYRILKKKGSCYVNIGDVYCNHNSVGVKKQSLLCLPDRFKINMVNNGWLCRNEIIWHKPNAMPSSAKTRFNNDYEKMFFFTKDDLYYFETQYEKAKTSKKSTKSNSKIKSNNNSKYLSDEQEKSVRQGMSKSRGNKIIEVRKYLPTQEYFVNFIRRTKIKDLISFVDGRIKKTTIEHWYRRDVKGFSYPTVTDWNIVSEFLNDNTEEFNVINYGLTTIDYETDDINKNLDKGRIKRAVWSINTKPLKERHFAPFPQELVETPIKASCPEGGIVIDPFIGSGTSGLVAKKLGRHYVGIEINDDSIKLANKRINELNF